MVPRPSAVVSSTQLRTQVLGPTAIVNLLHRSNTMVITNVAAGQPGSMPEVWSSHSLTAGNTLMRLGALAMFSIGFQITSGNSHLLSKYCKSSRYTVS